MSIRGGQVGMFLISQFDPRGGGGDRCFSKFSEIQKRRLTQGFMRPYWLPFFRIHLNNLNSDIVGATA